MALAIEIQPIRTSYLSLAYFGPSRSSMERGSCVSSIEESIEKSKSHWSQVEEFDFDNEVAEVSNMEFFKTLQGHPTWGTFFVTLGKGEGNCGDLVMGEKFAEGEQAEIYGVQIHWYQPKVQEYCLRKSHEFVLKVFKKGTFLRHLYLQWPQGMLKFHANKVTRGALGLPQLFRFHCEVLCGALLEDGRFAFVMTKEEGDLRSLIDRRMLTRSNNEGPFSKIEGEEAMYEVVLGINQLHNRDIVHKDIKASNVLIASNSICLLADFECSNGVVGTGFWRVPEILEACKHGNVNTKVELFTKAVDIYSYGMICYEILTGKLPFENHPWRDYDVVLQGSRPKLPNYIDGWIQKLLNRCWESNLVARPSSQEILKILLANSKICRNLDLQLQKVEVEVGIRKALDRSSKFVEISRSFKLKMPKLKMLRFYKK